MVAAAAALALAVAEADAATGGDGPTVVARSNPPLERELGRALLSEATVLVAARLRARMLGGARVAGAFVGIRRVLDRLAGTFLELSPLLLQLAERVPPGAEELADTLETRWATLRILSVAHTTLTSSWAALRIDMKHASAGGRHLGRILP